jgi:hypothetical protein
MKQKNDKPKFSFADYLPKAKPAAVTRPPIDFAEKMEQAKAEEAERIAAENKAAWARAIEGAGQ